MDHREFVAALPRGTRQELTRKSDRRGLSALVTHLGAIVLLAILIGLRVPFWPVLLLPQGILIIFLFTALHETIHRTAFKTPWINDAVAHLCGFLIVLPADWFRYFHFAHHRHTQDPEHDPELASPKPETWRQFAWHVSGLPIWAFHVSTLVRNSSGRCVDAFVPASARPKITREARLMLAGYAILAAASVALGSSLLLFVWIVPAVLGQPFLRLYLLAEHGRCAFVANMFENSRTTFTNRLIRQLAWNMPYHAEHHAYPTVPFWKLPELHALAKDKLKSTSPGYAAFTRDYAQMLGRNRRG